MEGKKTFGKKLFRSGWLAVVFILLFSITAFAQGEEEAVQQPALYATFWALVPPVVAIGLALITKEVYSSLMIGVAAGAVCGDHCSPISDTTIMASAGAQCNHVNHVSTQLPYAATVAAVSFVTYLIAGFVQTPWISLPAGLALLCAVLFGIHFIGGYSARK